MALHIRIRALTQVASFGTSASAKIEAAVDSGETCYAYVP